MGSTEVRISKLKERSVQWRLWNLKNREEKMKKKKKARLREICDTIQHILSTPKKNIQKLITFNEQYKNDINKIIPTIIASKRIRIKLNKRSIKVIL